MKTRLVFLLCVALCLITLLWIFAVSSGANTVSAQGPTTTADGQPPGTPPNQPVFADDGPDSRKNGSRSPQSPALSFSYYKVIGSVFQPRDSTLTYGYSSNGCIYQNGGATFRFQAPLILPEGSEIKYVRIYYLDTAATDLTVWLTRYEPGQANLDLTSVQSTGIGGYGTVLSPLITQTVDMATYAYELTWGTSVATSANQICGVRVAYYAPPVFGAFMPLIVK